MNINDMFLAAIDFDFMDKDPKAVEALARLGEANGLLDESYEEQIEDWD